MQALGFPCGIVRLGSRADTARMNEHCDAPDYTGHRFPPTIIAHAVWRYYRFARSYRDVEELLAERGVILTYERLSWPIPATSRIRAISSAQQTGHAARR